MNHFQTMFQFGRIYENEITQWLIHGCGYCVLPVYEVETEAACKGPRVYAPDGALAAPDLFAFSHRWRGWIEAKGKAHFTWHRISGTWQTGIDRVLYDDYLRLAKESPLPLWLMFLHKSDQPDARDLRQGSPERCPVGLFGGEILTLAKCVDHVSVRYGRGGMVYWRAESLRKLATTEQIDAANAGRKPVISTNGSDTKAGYGT